MVPSVVTEQELPDLADPASFSAEVPHAAFDAIRERPGLYWQPTSKGTQNGGFWAVTRQADIIEIEQNPAIFSSTRGVAFPVTGFPENHGREDHIFYMDPPRHSRVRRAAAKSFGPRVVAHFDEWVSDIVNEIIDDFMQKEEFDWVQDVAVPLPSRVVARIMGVPFEERQQIVTWALDMFEAQQKGDGGKSAYAVLRESNAYITELKEKKLRAPEEDMITILAQCIERGELEEGEFMHYIQSLLTAGFETTHTLIGQSMRLIVEDPDIAEKFHRTMAAAGPAPLIEEFLRIITPAMNFARTAMVDTEIAGQKIRQGDLMQMLYVAANRDPAVFEDPHVFDPDRQRPPHLAFGAGPHNCIGQALARLELRVLFRELEAREVRLELNGTPKRGHSTFINQLLSLPVRVVAGDVVAKDGVR